MEDAQDSSCIRTLAIAGLALLTTAVALIIIGFALRSWMCPLQPITGPTSIGDWPFTVVAMDGDTPVEAVHQYSGRVSRALAGTGNDRDEVQRGERRPIVWADTGRTTKPLRFYLTAADLRKANSRLDDPDPAEWRDIEVDVLDDDPAAKRQTLRVVDSDDMDDITNVYRVENSRIRPIAWSRFRPISLGFSMLLIVPLLFVASVTLWSRLLRKAFQPSRL